MAISGKRLDSFVVLQIERELRRGLSVYRIALDFQMSETTIRKIRQEMLTSVGNRGQ